MNALSPPPPSAPLPALASSFRLGALRSLPIAVGVVAFGLVWGALAGQAGFGLLEVALMSATVFAGAAQFVALDFWLGRPQVLPVGAILMATLAVNLRFALMSASLHPLFERERDPHRAWKAFFISDENWALTSAELARGGGSVGFLLGSGAVIYAAWVASSMAGRLLGAAIGDPARYGLDFAFTATFLALLLGLWKGRASIAPWGFAALVAVLVQATLPGKWYIVLGGLCGSVLAAMMSREDRLEGSTDRT